MVDQKREYFRVEFPGSYRPTLIMYSDNFEVEDVSEFGMKFKADKDYPFEIDEHVIASIVFPDGESFELSGQVIRVDENFVSLQLAEPLPLKKIRAVHLFLIKNH